MTTQLINLDCPYLLLQLGQLVSLSELLPTMTYNYPNFQYITFLMLQVLLFFRILCIVGQDLLVVTILAMVEEVILVGMVVVLYQIILGAQVTKYLTTTHLSIISQG
jgi:hypothetical protein